MALKSLNIYPLTKENLFSLLNFFCPNEDLGDVNWILEQEELALNQIEYALNIGLKHQDFIYSEVGKSGATISNLISYSCAALYGYINGSPSNNRKRITEELLQKFKESI